MTEYLVDTREQKPLFKGTRIKLNVGDYTTRSLRHFFCIERKSPHDLYQTITRNHSRFKAEILRAQAHKITLVVVVECRQKQFVTKAFDSAGRLQYPSTGLERIINTLAQRYDLEFVWCLNRKACQRYVADRLKKEEALFAARKPKRG